MESGWGPGKDDGERLLGGLTEWFNCSAFGRLAETCNQYLTKGKQVYVEGRLSSRTYQTQSRCMQSAPSSALSVMGKDAVFRLNLAT